MSTLTKWNPFRRSNGGKESGPLARWNPAREMELIEDRMERLFRNRAAWPELKEPLAMADWAPQVDIIEDNKEYLVKAEVLQVKREDLKVRVDDGVLQITGGRRSEKEEKGNKFHCIERACGRFERNFTLPDDADATKVSSEFKDGVLQVHLPKNPNAKTKGIEVKVQ